MSYDSDAVVDGRRLRFRRRGLFRHVAIAEDAVTGEVLASWSSKDRRLTTGLAELGLGRAGLLRMAWVLTDGDAEVARFEPRGLGGSRMRVFAEPGAAGLTRLVLLFAAWLVACQVRDDSAAAAGATTAATTAATG